MNKSLRDILDKNRDKIKKPEPMSLEKAKDILKKRWTGILTDEQMNISSVEDFSYVETLGRREYGHKMFDKISEDIPESNNTIDRHVYTGESMATKRIRLWWDKNFPQAMDTLDYETFEKVNDFFHDYIDNVSYKDDVWGYYWDDKDSPSDMRQ